VRLVGAADDNDNDNDNDNDDDDDDDGDGDGDDVDDATDRACSPTSPASLSFAAVAARFLPPPPHPATPPRILME